MKKIISISMMLVLILMLVSCAGNTTTTTSTTASNATTSSSGTTSETMTAEGAELELMIWGSTNEQDAQRASCAAFDAKYNTNTTVTWVASDEFFAKLTARLAANDAPSLSYSQSWNYKLYEEGYLWNFNDLISKYGEASGVTADDWIDTVWYNYSPTEVLGPVFASVTNGLMYNTELFEDAGIDLPPTTVDEAWTWDEFVEVAQKLTLDVNGNNALSPNFDPTNIKQFGIGTDLNMDIMFQFIYGNGGNILSEDGKSTDLINEKGYSVIQNFADLVNKYHVHPTKTQSSGFESVASAMKSKQLAMFMGGSWRQLDIVAADFDWGVGVMPMGDIDYVASFVGSTLLAYKAEEDSYAQYLLYTYLCDPQSSNEILSMYQTLWIPSIKAYYTDPSMIDVWASEDLPGRPTGFQDAIVKATYENRFTHPMLLIKNFPEFTTQFNELTADVWTGDETAQEAMNNLNDAVVALDILDGTYTGERR